jgi:hypothetical protein
MEKRERGLFGKMKCSSRAQVWIETVIYTLIGLVIIGVVLMAARPKIEEMKDKAIIEQTISSLNEINDRIFDVDKSGFGNRRIVNVGVSKGKFYVNSSANEIGWIIENSRYKYSEIGRIIPLGNIKVITSEGDPYLVKFFIEYTSDLTVNEKEEDMELTSASIPYKLVIENEGGLDLSVS